MKEKSIIIIGAGLAGLSSGCYAQMNGYKSRIFEMHNIPGGLCTSWKRNDYIFDGCIHYMMGSRFGQYNEFYKELGAVQDREMFNPDELMRVEGLNGKSWIVYTDLDRLERHMKELSPADSEIIGEFCKAARLFTRVELPVDKPMEMMGVVDMLKLLKIMPAMMTMSKYNKLSMQAFAARFKDPFLKNVFPMILEDIPDMPMTAVLMTLAYLHLKNNGWPIGGSLEYARSIEKRYCNLGGRVQYNSQVEKILVEADKAVGIRLSDGTEHYADLVVSAADGRSVIFDMLNGKFTNDKIKSYYEKMDIYKPYVQISLGVTDDYSREPHSFIVEVDKPIKVGDQFRNWIPFKHYCYDPNMAPPGKSVITASFVFVDFEYWKTLHKNPAMYNAEKQSLAEAIINQLEKRCPGIRKKIETVDVATPVTYERYTGNWHGSYMGWKGNAGDTNTWMKRTLPGLQGFYMAGQWVFPGGGVSGAIVSGRQLIQVICRKDKKRFGTIMP